MKHISVKELRKKWIEFNVLKGHVEIENHSIVPKSKEGEIFTIAGMHPIVEYFSDREHGKGSRLTNSQRCIRTNDIESIGDETHCTFFEMLGTWSLGDYFKEKAIKDTFEFINGKKYLNIPINKIAVSVFQGDNIAPRDNESAIVWEQCGIYKENIFFMGKSENWWSMGDGGPCGPDTEIFYIKDNIKCDNKDCSPACDCGKYVEIGNNVFIQYNSDPISKEIRELTKKSVDRGMGLERLVMTMNDFTSVYEIDVFKNAINTINEFSEVKYDIDNIDIVKSYRIIAEHLRTITVILGDKNKTTPSNTGRGYILRRLIRRVVRYARTIKISTNNLNDVISGYIDYYKDDFVEFGENKKFIIMQFEKEVEKFKSTILYGIKEFEKVVSNISTNIFPGNSAFKLYDTYGFPIELTTEMANNLGLKVDIDGYNKAYKIHQEKSKGDIEKGKYKGGLVDDNYNTIKHHTASHLVLAALNSIYNGGINQRGSNNNSERMRLDFNFDRKMTDSEITKLEDIVNEQIKNSLEVSCEEMSIEEAKKIGATGVFDEKYKNIDKIKVYKIGDFSKEICMGPHVKNTKELGRLKVIKEQSSSSGVRRIKCKVKA